MRKSKEESFGDERGDTVDDLLKPVSHVESFEEELERLRVVERIVELRKKAGLSQKELALRIHETETFVQQMESKMMKSFEVNLLIRIAHALGCKLEVNFRHPDDRSR